MLNKIRENIKTHRPPAPVILLVLVALAVTAWLIIRNQNDQNGPLKASGTIEGVTVRVAPEMAGRVGDVLVEQGQAVRTGDPLLRLDPSLLAAQRAYAAAGVVTANSAAQTAQTASPIGWASAPITSTSQPGISAARNRLPQSRWK
jgi:HlyD family secretion protein